MPEIYHSAARLDPLAPKYLEIDSFLHQLGGADDHREGYAGGVLKEREMRSSIGGEYPPQRTNDLQNETNDEFIHIVMPLEQVNLMNPGNSLLRRGTGSKLGKLSDSLLGDPNHDDG